MKKIIFGFILIVIGLTGCKKYSDSYLNPSLPKSLAYFASFQEYSRTVVVGEGLHFQIGAAMGGLLTNTQDRTVDFQIGSILNMTTVTDPRLILPTSYYTIVGAAGATGTNIRAIIPAGQFLGYFTVNLDSINFLNDPISMYKSLNNEGYTIPVKIVATSLDSIEKGLDSIKVSVKYIAGEDGYYLYQQTIKKEVAGAIIDSKTVIDNYPSEADNSTFRLLTQGPFKVKVTGATTSFTSGLNFNMYVDMKRVIIFESIVGQPVVTPEATNIYDPHTRDFTLNYKYQKASVLDTIYHVSGKLIFRNRILDKVNQTRDYLSYTNP